MTRIIVGSTAARLHIPAWRAPKDYDLFCDRLHVYKADIFWDERLRQWWGEDERYATLDELYTIKLSHAYWELENGSWLKHMTDLWQLKMNGAMNIPQLHTLLYDVWQDRYGKKTVDLNMDKADFFDDVVPRKWDHDSVHYSVAYGDHPVYESVLKEGEEVAVDMARIKMLPFEQQVRLFREEVYATALERRVIPKNYICSPMAEYSWALRRTITRLTKGWSARFIADNYDVFRKPDMDYVAQHKSKSHLLIPFKRKGDV